MKDYEQEWYKKLAQLTNSEYFKIADDEVKAAKEILEELGYTIYWDTTYNQWYTCYGYKYDFDLIRFCMREMERNK
jgi:hypothetical protein